MENKLYIGKYLLESIKEEPEKREISIPSVIDLPNSNLRVLNKYIGADFIKGEVNKVDEKVTLVVEDEDFWPYICKLDKEEAKDLRDSLDEMIKNLGKEEQLTEKIG